MDYTVQETRMNGLPPVTRTYHGFKAARNTDYLLPESVVAFVQSEDTMEVWLLENREAEQELRRYYREQDDRDSVGIVFGQITSERLWEQN